ncbi:dTDP-4-dehydrorhamnose 3,5-epimerase [Sphingobacterium multivorum]|uniref:dTDP-4-dehydrorhamnose 3,5-epimerase n=1 Tax=Sphingobacterium multivorum TaxID=28454 RepID=UPI0028B0046E|nr:dTDP-4-dehydrorhamnose 3,5-epimerase [Sphingobacterium multivorum]
MTYTETKLKGCFILEPTVFEDERGYFFESFNETKLKAILGYTPQFVQDNQSKSQFGVVRGLHMQVGEHAQAKLVRVVEGSVWDVAVDVRPESPTFGQYIGIELSAENKKQLFVPRGFLHGFSVLSEHAVFFYKCDNNYHKESEDGVNPLDLDLAVDWRIPAERMILSQKDQEAQSFEELRSKLI